MPSWFHNYLCQTPTNACTRFPALRAWQSLIWSDQMSKFFKWYFKIIFIHLLYHDTLKFSVNFDCIMIQWVSISKMKEAWNGSILLHLSCLYHFGYVHWMYHDTFKLWINIECIMIQSRVKPEILSSNCVLIRKPRTVQTDTQPIYIIEHLYIQFAVF